MDIKNNTIALLSSIFSKEITLMVIAALPVFELRLAIPLAIFQFGFSFSKAYCLAVAGNFLPVLPLLLFFRYFFHRLENVKVVGKFFSWWFKRVEKKSKVVERLGFWGLVFFVAIPLPVTGAWTGTVAATLFEIKLRKALLAIFIGIAIAGLLVSLITAAALGLFAGCKVSL
ncbi:MAG: small multi-drug export protein [Candidatus Omnitrophica bacterium]|nr:small multi-drug export protein [Candidatus Omnitrophota bacterium]MDD5429369.1 small multi-drug export protein [Candidatus Omnitrophota bacterium]